MKKNGSSVANGTVNVSANNFYTLTCAFLNVAVNDVLEIALWSNQSDSSWDYKAYQVQVSRIIVWEKLRVIKPFTVSNSLLPWLTLGNPNAFANRGLYPQHLDISFAGVTDSGTIELLKAGNTYGMFRLGQGDNTYADTAQSITHTTIRPYYARNYAPTVIKIRGLRID
jgi:hypothetical protein